MQGIINATVLAIALAFVVPGYIIGTVRSLFLTGRRSIKPEAQVFEALGLSAVNLVICYPIVAYLVERAGPSTWLAHMSWLVVLIAIPVLAGVCLGTAARNGWAQSLLHQVGLAPVHAMPTAWDWKFAQCQPSWVLVTLTDGTKFAGYCGAGSFMSSEPSERDLYIEAAFDVADDNQWHQKRSGVYISHGQISTIECWAVTQSKENIDNVETSAKPPICKHRVGEQGLSASNDTVGIPDAA
jgi:Family of unknown function (DUF6338)